MHRVFRHIGILISGLLAFSTTAVAIDLSGEIGLDLKRLSYTTSYVDTTSAFSIGRSQSHHYANLFFAGALINSHFANYSTSAKVYGMYVNSSTDETTESEYVKPDLRGFYGQMTFLPEKKYPFQIYRSNYQDYTLRYEANNRSDRERLQPSLSILRRYQSERDATGALWQYMPSETVRLLSEIKEENTQTSRIYEFGENLDIWVSYIASSARPGDTVFTVLLDNQMPDTADIQIVNLDSLNANPGFPILTINDLPPNMTRTVYLFPGQTEIQIASPGFNPYFNIINVDSNFVISIKYRDPAAPNNVNQTRKVFTNQLRLGDDNSRAQDQIFYEYSDQNESVQKQSTYLHNFSNTAGYELSENLAASLFSSYQMNRTRIDTVSLQWNQVFLQQSSMSYTKRHGLSASIMHMYSRNSSHLANPSLPPEEGDDPAKDTLTSSMHNINARLTHPSRKWGHRFDLNTGVIMLSDNKRTSVPVGDTSIIKETPYNSNQYTGEITNSIDIMFQGVNWLPRHSFKYVKTSQENPDQNSQEINSKFYLVGEKTSDLLGDLRLKTEYDYRNRWDDVGSDTKSRYILDFMLMRRLGTGYRVSFLANQEWEVTGGSAPSLSGSGVSASNTVFKSSYKLDINASLLPDVNLTGSIMLIKQGDNSISKYGFSVNTLIPIVKAPLKSVLVAESRKLAGQDPQNQIRIETKVSHNIRKISIVLQHLYQREKLLFETYSINEIQGRISRQFTVF